ncbi:hypothetical protein [Lentzea sp. NBRC 102530]|uniref:hypothetical protein n=1 Tax=Lentzea sp. NBRC 102530 TaxID=3032201 RepID=UPI0024A2BF59|nr:hypothetical protein [Lentzea sp. NBRC 102530]GLY50179.1 hypothetical protein Lesp01_38350 [Lentzea sp. NBRC 102530]
MARDRSLISDVVNHLDKCSTADQGLSLATRALYSLGVHSAYTDLSSSPFESGRCMRATKLSLSFMGHTASKWRNHPDFEAFLRRMTANHGKVQFLLSEDVSGKVTQDLLDLEQRHKCFRAKIYFSRPMFRLVIQDEQIIALQHYEGLGVVPVGDRNDSPLMTLTARGEDSLFRTLVVHFKELWTEARPVSEL